MRLDPEPVVEYVSPAAREVTGYAPEDFYAEPGLWQALVHPDDRGRIPDLLAIRGRSRAEIETPALLRVVHRDGTIRWTEHRSVPVYDPGGRTIAIEGSSRDVTHASIAGASVTSSTRTSTAAPARRQASATSPRRSALRPVSERVHPGAA